MISSQITSIIPYAFKRLLFSPIHLLDLKSKLKGKDMG